MDDAVIEAALAALRSQLAPYKLFDDYYDGNHRLAFATPKFNSAFGALFRAFADNLTPAVVDAVADRLIIEGFTAEGDGENESIIADTAAIWSRNRMDRRAGEVHVEALKGSNAYLVVWPDERDKPVFYPNRGDRMTVNYDPETPGLIRWAAKGWHDTVDKRFRLTIYTPEGIWKYATRPVSVSRPNTPVVADSTFGTIPERRGALEPLVSDREAWPLPNKWAQVPVFHFANNAAVGGMGVSELRDVIPLQDGLNKSIADMMVGMEFTAFPQRFIIGWEPETDDVTGKPKSLPSSVDRFVAFAEKDVKVEQLTAADFEQFIHAQEVYRKEIAAVSRTPIQYLSPATGEQPSGESLKTAEAPFLSKVNDRMGAFGNVWEDAMTLALRMSGTELGDRRLSCVWKDPTPRSDNERVERVAAWVAMGWSREAAMAIEGFPQEDIDRMTAAESASLSVGIPR